MIGGDARGGPNAVLRRERCHRGRRVGAGFKPSLPDPVIARACSLNEFAEAKRKIAALHELNEIEIIC